MGTGIGSYVHAMVDHMASLVVMVMTLFVLIYLWIAYDDTTIMAIAGVGGVVLGSMAGYMACDNKKN